MTNKISLAGIGPVQDGDYLDKGGSPYSFSSICGKPALPTSYVSPPVDPNTYWQEGFHI